MNHYCPAGSKVATKCDPGFQCPRKGLDKIGDPCPAGKYCPLGIIYNFIIIHDFMITNKFFEE